MDNTNSILPQSQPLSRYAKKILETVEGSGGFLQAYNIEFSRAIGLTSTGQNEFLEALNECVDKNYVRVLFTKSPMKKNGFFTKEYFDLNVSPRLQQNSEVYQVPTEYNSDTSMEVQSETEPH